MGEGVRETVAGCSNHGDVCPIDKAGSQYWDKLWQIAPLTGPVNPQDTSLNNHINLVFHKYFLSLFGRDGGRGKCLIEVGCAASTWLAYFATEFGFLVSGLDYSATGCEKARTILGTFNIPGKITEGDLFDPPSDLVGRFDVVISFGLVEHFSSTSGVVSKLASLVKQGGLVVTSVPNMAYMIGWVQKVINRQVYDIHVPLDRELLAGAHDACGLEVLDCRYLGTTNWGVLNAGKTPRWWARQTVRCLYQASKVVWLMEKCGLPEVPNRFTSPYVVCTARASAGF